MLANQFVLKEAAKSLLEFTEEALSPRAERLQIAAFLASDALADGLASGKPAVRRRAEELRDEALRRWENLTGRAYNAGAAVTLSFARGIYENAWNAEQAAARLAAGVAGFLPQSEPANPRSALRGITTTGDKLVASIVAGMWRRMPDAEDASLALTRALALGNPNTAARLGAARYAGGAGSAGLPIAAAAAGLGGARIQLDIHWSSLAVPTRAEGQRVARAIAEPLRDELRRQRILPGPH
jgi:hypothetical protein